MMIKRDRYQNLLSSRRIPRLLFWKKKEVHLFAGLEQIAKGQSKIPVILKFLEHLINLGFELNYVMID